MTLFECAWWMGLMLIGTEHEALRGRLLAAVQSHNLAAVHDALTGEAADAVQVAPFQERRSEWLRGYAAQAEQEAA